MSKRKKSTRKSTQRRRGKNGRPPKETPDWAPLFLEAIIEGSHVRDATKAAGVSGKLPYKRRLTDLEFGKAWDEASHIGTKALEAEAGRRAFHGTLKPVFHKGKVADYIREYSDTLLMLLLRGRRPNKYRDNAKFEHVGKDGAELPRVMIYLPDNGRSKPDDAANEGTQATETEGTPSGSEPAS